MKENLFCFGGQQWTLKLNKTLCDYSTEGKSTIKGVELQSTFETALLILILKYIEGSVHYKKH